MNIKNIFDLKEKTIVITGGAGYLGSAMSEALASFGAKLFILGQDEKKNQLKSIELKKKYGLTDCMSFPFNVNDEKLISACFSEIIKETGSIDVLINNAAYVKFGRVENMVMNDWCTGIDGTINNVFRVTQIALQYMLSAERGNIINIGSMYGMVAPDPSVYGDSGYDNPANYGVGKAAIIQFTKYIAATYGRRGIRSNAISPGPFPGIDVQENKDFIQKLSNKNPLGRIGKPEDLQGLIVYLASDASSYMTGQNIAIDGGWTAW